MSNVAEAEAMRSSWIVSGLVLLIAAGAAFAAHRPKIEQPIRFSHAKHVAAGVDCDGCHETAADQTFAGMPTLETCLQCHDEPPKSAEEKKLAAFAARKAEPAWQRIYRMPGHVFFSHRRHVAVGKVQCSVCHGAMDKATAPPAGPAVKQSMAWCMACHEERHASIDCIACHR